jgi:hypothetical protein
MEEDHRLERRAKREEQKRLAKEQLEKEEEEAQEKPEEPEANEQATGKDGDEAADAKTEAEETEEVSCFSDWIDNEKETDESTQKDTATGDPGQVSDSKKKTWYREGWPKER